MEAKATKRPSALTAGDMLPLFACAPELSTLTRSVMGSLVAAGTPSGPMNAAKRA